MQLLSRYGGFDSVAMTDVGAHSLKATALSWAAKADIPSDVRRFLGGHAIPKDKSMLEYGRDNLAGPLRE